MHKHNCNKNKECSASIHGTQVYYKFNNLRHHNVSCGENHDAIIEKLFAKISMLQEEIEKLKNK